jgi:hypothetical protein
MVTLGKRAVNIGYPPKRVVVSVLGQAEAISIVNLHKKPQ